MPGIAAPRPEVGEPRNHQDDRSLGQGMGEVLAAFNLHHEFNLPCEDQGGKGGKGGRDIGPVLEAFTSHQQFNQPCEDQGGKGGKSGKSMVAVLADWEVHHSAEFNLPYLFNVRSGDSSWFALVEDSSSGSSRVVCRILR